jgi:hydrogenase expression/formation protein HypC
MCLAIPGEVVEVGTSRPDHATVEIGGVRRLVNIGLVAEEGLDAGDWVLVHVGFALSKVDEEEAQAALQFLESIGQAYQDELEALAESDIG